MDATHLANSNLIKSNRLLGQSQSEIEEFIETCNAVEESINVTYNEAPPDAAEPGRGKRTAASPECGPDQPHHQQPQLDAHVLPRRRVHPLASLGRFKGFNPSLCDCPSNRFDFEFEFAK